MESLTRQEIKELFYITPQENIPSILRLGILAHNDISLRKIPHDLWHMEEVQRRREQIFISQSRRRLHDYVNLYFNCRNAALYARREMHECLCVLSIDAAICDLPEALVTPFNAASANACFYQFTQGIEHLHKEHLFARWWTEENGEANNTIKSQMMAELLIPSIVAPSYIRRAYVCSLSSQQNLQRLAPAIISQVRLDLFFRTATGVQRTESE